MSLNKASNEAFQSNSIQSNPDPTKKSSKGHFSRKLERPTLPPLKFNGIFIADTTSLKKLVLVLGSKLNFRRTPTKHTENLPKQLKWYVHSKYFTSTSITY